MAVRIRLKRMGKKKRPFYRVVVADARVQRDGSAIDTIGWYDPMAEKAEARSRLDEAKALKWLRRGAQPSDTVRTLLRDHKVLQQLATEKADSRKTPAA